MVTSTPVEIGTPRHSLQDLSRRVEAEYAEMPGLSVTLPQAERLWGLDRQVCGRVLGHLVARGVLRRTSHDRYVRRS